MKLPEEPLLPFSPRSQPKPEQMIQNVRSWTIMPTENKAKYNQYVANDLFFFNYVWPRTFYIHNYPPTFF